MIHEALPHISRLAVEAAQKQEEVDAVVVDDATSWIQLAITVVTGAFFAVFSGLFKNVYTNLSDLRRRQEELAREVEKNAKEGDSDLWQEINRMREGMEIDRRKAAEDRKEIAEKMVTKDELKEQVDRVISVLQWEHRTR